MDMNRWIRMQAGKGEPNDSGLASSNGAGAPTVEPSGQAGASAPLLDKGNGAMNDWIRTQAGKKEKTE